MENDKLLEEAIELGIIVPTEEEVQELVNGQKIDFMTTFKKKKTDVEKPQEVVDLDVEERPKAKNHVSGSNIKNNPPKKPQTSHLLAPAKQKKTHHSAIVEVQEISDQAIKISDKYNKPKIYERKNVVNSKKYEPIRAKKVAPRVNHKFKIHSSRNNNLAPPKKASASSNSKPSTASGVKQKIMKSARAYEKPWQRPKTAGLREEAKKGTDNKPQNQEHKRKDAKDIMSKRKHLLKPAIKKTSNKEKSLRKTQIKSASKMDMKKSIVNKVDIEL